MKEVKIEIITIGDEILIGQIVDTNSAWMAAELNKVGFQIVQLTSISDQAEDIKSSLGSAMLRADVVLITGGIGPTKDDITKQTLCSFFGTKLVHNTQVLANIERLFAHRPNAMNDLNLLQAMVPEQCTVIQNLVGTAPITWFEKDEKVIVSMPGVPYEMKHVMHAEIIPRLKECFQRPDIIHQNIQVYGYSESALALKISEWENALPTHIRLAYLPNYGIVKLRLSGVGAEGYLLESEVVEQLKKLQIILGDAIIFTEDIHVAQWLGKMLLSQGKTLATAESCTGGNISHQMTSISGSSTYFKGSVVAYANEVKTDVLGVSKFDIDRFGAVSQSVVEQMAQGVRALLQTDIGIATSGIAGPTGGSADKPVGTVWIAVCSAEKMISREFNFGKLREQNIERATQAAMLMVREL